MNAPNAWMALALVCATLLSGASLAQTQPKHPAKAPLPAKPPTMTAVAPKGPISPGGQNDIIFVGGHVQTLGYAALNPQPIPPGHPVLINPPH
jgi:hypothetical protein